MRRIFTRLLAQLDCKTWVEYLLLEGCVMFALGAALYGIATRQWTSNEVEGMWMLCILAGAFCALLVTYRRMHRNGEKGKQGFTS